jgi:hypothetical protein
VPKAGLRQREFLKDRAKQLAIGKIQMIAEAGTSLQLVMVDLSCYGGVGVSLPLAQPRREVIAALSKLSQS